MKRPAPDRITRRAEQERQRILQRDILAAPLIRLGPLAEDQASREISEFAATLWRVPRMRGYFDPDHLTNMRHHLGEARHGFTSLAQGGVAEVVVLPVMDQGVMGFHLFNVFDPADPRDDGERIGYTVYSLERGTAGFDRADAVRMAFDIFPGYRGSRFQRIRFTNHEIYNLSRRILFQLRPKRFLVDARTQISQSRTGDRVKRAVYYLKRGYFPPDQKRLADRLLVRMKDGEQITPRSARILINRSRSLYWVYPVARYLRNVGDTGTNT